MPHVDHKKTSVQSLYKHVQTSRIYTLLARATDKTTGEEVVVFQSDKSGRVWVRPSQEFFDGRYQEVSENDAARTAARATASNEESQKMSESSFWRW